MSWLREGHYWEVLSYAEQCAVLGAVQGLVKIVSEQPIGRVDWLDLAGKLRVVLDKDYPITDELEDHT